MFGHFTVTGVTRTHCNWMINAQFVYCKLYWKEKNCIEKKWYMCFVHPSTVPQCDVYKSDGVTLSWSSNDWSPSINGTRACGDIDLFWSEQTSPRDFRCDILGLDPELPRSSLKVEYLRLWLQWSAWVATIIHLVVSMIATHDVSMTCVWLGDYKIGARSIDRLNGTLIREGKEKEETLEKF